MKLAKSLIILSGLALLCCGCYDSNSNDTQPEECAATEANQCSGTHILTCQNGVWTETENCEYGCDKGTCLSQKDESECQAEDAPTCIDDKNIQECVDGQWNKHECTSGTTDIINVCVVASGKHFCSTLCKGEIKDAGNNDYCFSPHEAPEQNYAVHESCAKDDNGVIYATERSANLCESGCKEGTCQETQCSLNCMKDGGRPQTCVVINAQEQCKDTCLGNNVGENQVCYQNASLGPNAPEQSVIDICQKDDFGTLYSEEANYTECTDTCTDGVCDDTPVTVECSLTCANLGSRPQTCVVIKGKEQCQNTCLGTEVGENMACYKNASLGPSAKTQSVIDTCQKDDAGTLYSVSSKYTDCQKTCNNGLCDYYPDQPKCSKDCNMVGGRSKTCVIVDGQEQCMNTCLGKSVGENQVCYQNASLGPNAPEQSVIDTCQLDPLGTLYSVSSKTTNCASTCTDGKCD